MDSLLSVKNLTVAVASKVLVDDVSFDVPQGKIVAIAGGSGSGKTTIGLSIMRLLPAALSMRHGRIDFEGKNLLSLSPEKMRQCRGRQIGMIFQEPLCAFDPLFTIGQQMEEVLAAHTRLSPKTRKTQVLKTIERVELPDPERVYRSFPHQLSGGMCQRAMIAQALVGGPSLIIADEATSNLDLLLQAKIMQLLRDIKVKGNVSFLLITHDLSVIAHLADEVIILQEGKMVEKGAARQVIESPQQEYTKALVEAFQ